MESVVILLNANAVACLKKGPYGVNSVRRLIRQFRNLGAGHITLIADERPDVTPELLDGMPVTLLREAGSQISQNATPLFIIDGDVIADERLMRMVWTETDVRLEQAGDTPLFMKIDPGKAASTLSESSDLTQWKNRLEMAVTERKNISACDRYLIDSGQEFARFLHRVGPNTKVFLYEGVLFERYSNPTSNFVWQFMFKYPIRDLCRVFSRSQFSPPLLFSLLGFVLTIAAPGFFMKHQFGYALWCAWLAMFSVELGKMLGELKEKEHGLVAGITLLSSWVWPVVWPLLFAWSLMTSHEDAMQYLVMWLAGTAISELTITIVKKRTARHPDDLTLTDRIFSLVASDEAILILLMTLGHMLHHVATGFFAAAIWSLVTAAFRTVRMVRHSLIKT